MSEKTTDTVQRFDPRRTRSTIRGHRASTEAKAEVRQLLGFKPRRADLLIEYLHLINDRHKGLPVDLLAALAEELSLPLSRVYETASFYSHFTVLQAGDIKPEMVVRVCDSPACQMRGAASLHQAIEGGIDPSRVRLEHAPCMGRCEQAPVVAVGQNHITRADAQTVQQAIAEKDTRPKLPAYRRFDDYVAEGGYQLLRSCLLDERNIEELISSLGDMRGLGGAGFPTARKWQIVRQQPGPRLVAINGDEGEPGTFKDRHYLEQDPHRFLEGALISCWAVGSEELYIYLRDEYPHLHQVLREEIRQVTDAGLAPVKGIHLRRGAGAYICGEESAMLESLEGKPGLPRQRPPYVAQRGLFDRPTLVNNVETVYWIRDLIEKGSAWFRAHGMNGRAGFRSFSVSGRVREPGVKLAPAGITLTELIDEYCGGMEEGHTLKAYLPGGASGGILPASKADIPLDFDTLNPYGCFIGSAAVLVISEQDDLKAIVCNLMEFFRHESCGQCSPCRLGTRRLLEEVNKPVPDEDKLRAISTMMRNASICGLGQAAPNPVDTVLNYFDGELVELNPLKESA